jgi:hypothetical protein
VRKKVAAILDVLFRLGQDAARARARHRHHRRQDLATPSCARQAASRCTWSAPGPPVSAWFRRGKQSMRRTMKSRHSATARRIAVHRRARHHRRHVAQTPTPPTPTMAASKSAVMLPATRSIGSCRRGPWAARTPLGQRAAWRRSQGASQPGRQVETFPLC